MERLAVSLEVLASHVGFARYHFPIPPGTDCQGLGGAWKPAFEQIPHDHWVLHQLRNLQGVLKPPGPPPLCTAHPLSISDCSHPEAQS